MAKESKVEKFVFRRITVRTNCGHSNAFVMAVYDMKKSTKTIIDFSVYRPTLPIRVIHRNVPLVRFGVHGDLEFFSDESVYNFINRYMGSIIVT